MKTRHDFALQWLARDAGGELNNVASPFPLADAAHGDPPLSLPCKKCLGTCWPHLTIGPGAHLYECVCGAKRSWKTDASFLDQLRELDALVDDANKKIDDMSRKIHNGEPGYVAERTNPYCDGFKVVIYTATDLSIDAFGGKYLLVCDRHTRIGGFPSMAKARHAMKNPDEFCIECNRHRRGLR